MKVVSKAALQSNLLEIIDLVESMGEHFIVTSNGQPVLKITPYRQELTVAEAFGDVLGKVRYHGDLLEPTVGEWEAS
ncbi:MAG: type II toxin-antitoxin system Phd/YefM family antitoxin [Methylococcales bacterium]